MERASREARSAGRAISARTVLIATMMAFVLVHVSTAVSAGSTTIHYSWDHEGENVSFDLTVQDEYIAGYESYELKERFDYGSMLTVQDPHVMIAAIEIREIAEEHDFDRAELALTFVQSFEYSEDNEAKGCRDYARFPLEMLVDSTGDCEDKAMLLTVLLIDLGYDSVLFVIYDNTSGHMASGVAGNGFSGGSVMHNGTEYFYAETTSRGFDIGDVPSGINLTDIEVVEKSAPKSQFHDPEEETDDLPPWYYFIMGALMAGALAAIAAVLGSRKGRKAAEAEESEKKWKEYEQYERTDSGLNIINEPRTPPKQRAPRTRSRPPPEEYGYDRDRRMVNDYMADDDGGSEDTYNPYK